MICRDSGELSAICQRTVPPSIIFAVIPLRHFFPNEFREARIMLLIRAVNLSALGEFMASDKQNAMNTVTVTLRVIKGKGDEFLQVIRSFQEKVKKEEGFRKCTIYRDVTDESMFNLIEEWETQDHLDRHLRSDLFRVLIGALKVLSTESEVMYRLVSDKQGGKVVELT
jgi:quinol monooxygenase YgiN